MAEAPWLLARPPLVPFMEARTARPPGLMPLVEGEMITHAPDFGAQMARREALIASVPLVVNALMPEAEAAARELLGLVAAEALTLPDFAREGEIWQRPDGGRAEVDPARPLLSLGRMVAEDFCLLMPDREAGEYRLVGAILCFPSRWSLAEKMGRPLTAIHAPVPGYAEALAPRVNRVFEALRPGRGLWRANWLIHASPELHLPMGLSDKLVAEADPADGIYLRTERQTLIRLPETGAVAFGIKTSTCPLEALDGREAAALGHALAMLDPAEIAYRSGTDMHGAALARAAEIAGQSGVACPQSPN